MKIESVFLYFPLKFALVCVFDDINSYFVHQDVQAS